MKLRQLFGEQKRVPGEPGTSTYFYDGYRCDVVTSPGDLDRHWQAWEDLQLRVVEDNFYFSPSILASTIRHFGKYRFYVVFVYQCFGGVSRLIACAPFSLLPRTARSVTPILSTFIGPHTYLSHPLLDRDLAVPALNAIWNWIERPGQAWNLVRLQHMSTESPTCSLIRDELDRRGRACWIKDSFLRAKLHRHESYEAFQSALPSSRLKSLRRRRRCLEKRGDVRVEIHRSPLDPKSLADRFMNLEAMGWKGERGSALRQSPCDKAFFTEVTLAAAKQRHLLFIEIAVANRPVAIAANFALGHTMFAFKIAYDPAFQECSPGILVEMETVRAFHAEPDLLIADGGTVGDSYLEKYWQRFHQMQEVYVSTGSYRSEWQLRVTVGLTRAKRGIQRMFAGTLATVWRNRESGGLGGL